MNKEEIQAVIVEYLKSKLTIEISSETVYSSMGDGQWTQTTVYVYLDGEEIARAQQ